MSKHLPLSITFIFLAGCFLCQAQPIANRAPAKSGTLSTSSSSGGGAGGGTIYIARIDTDKLSLLDASTAIFCLNNSTMVLGVSITSTDPDWPAERGYWYYQDVVSDTLESFSLNGTNYVYDSVIIN